MTTPAKIETWAKPEEMARMFHELYEEFAPRYNYTTRKESAIPWDELPENHKQLMVDVCWSIITAHAPQEPSVPVRELKAWRNAASIPLTYSDAVAFDELIHQAAQPTEKEDD